MLRSPRTRRLATLPSVALVAALALSACGSGNGGAAADSGSGRLDVVAAFYPLQFVAERVGGPAVRVTNVTKPGVEPHDLELDPVQVGQISDAALVVYLAGFQPQVDDAVQQEAGDRAFDVASAVSLLNGGEGGGQEHDPHIWLDPGRLATIAGALADRLGTIDPAHRADYQTRVAALRADLLKLDREYTNGLETCQRHEIVTSHAAFAYLADRYHLTQVAIAGLTPEEEPSAQRLADVVATARDHHATTIFFETLVSPKVAETIAREVGAKTAVLDPIEGLQPGSSDDYLSVMRRNLATLRPALGCT